MEKARHIYEQFFDIEPSDTWSLNDLLRYALELIINDGDGVSVADLPEDDFIAARELLNEEIDNAIREQKRNKTIPPMPLVASEISCLGDFLRKDELNKLEKLLMGGYRGKRGVKNDAEETKRDDIERMLIYKKYRGNLTHQESIAKLAQQERIHERSAERSILRGQKNLRANIHAAGKTFPLSRIKMYSSIRHRIIVNEIQRLLSSSDKSTRVNYRDRGNFNNLIKNLDQDINPDT